MIIQCPSCSSRYRIQEDKLPEAGGNIRCPNCAHIFFVGRDGVTRPERTPSGPEAEAPRPAAGAPPPLPDPFEEEGPTPTNPGASRRWKLKNPVGLVYDFADTEQIRRWLASRESFEGITVSSDGGASWLDVAAVDDLADLRATGRKIHGGGGPVTIPRTTGSLPKVGATGPNPMVTTGSGTAATAEKLREQAEARLKQARDSRKIEEPPPPPQYKYVKPPSNEHEAKASRFLLLLALAVLPCVAVAGLHLVGVIDLREWGLLPGGDHPAAAPAAIAARPDGAVEGSAGVEISPEQAVNLLISQAAAAVSRDEPDVAVQYMERAIALLPNDAELHCIVEPMYRQLNRNADASSAAARCRPPQEGSAADGSAAPPSDGSAPAAAPTP